MGIYNTVWISRQAALEKIKERLPIVQNRKILAAYGEVSDFVDEVDGPGTRNLVPVIIDVLEKHGLEKLPSRECGNMLDEVLGNIMDTLFREETLNNFNVNESGKAND